MASSNSCIATFGFHREEILALKNEWVAVSSDSAHHREGLRVLSALSQRDKKFYFADKNFDFPDYPIKILPYPESQPIPTTADAIHDISTIKTGDPVICMRLHDGVLARGASISGRNMVNAMFEYLANQTAENLRNVVLPLSVPISKEKCRSTDTGLGEVDVNMLVPPFFRSEGRIFLPDSKEGWTARFLIPAAFSKMVNNHYICGHIRAHLFGRNIWLFSPPDEEHLELWYSNPGNECGVEKTMEFVQSAEKLVVWVSSRPCVVVLPPHCFHAMFTLTPACDIGVRVGSDFWEEEMKTVSKFMEKAFEKPGVGVSAANLVDEVGEILRDFGVWVSWAEDIKREPREKEKELMRGLAPLVKKLKVIIGRECSC